MSLSLLEFEPMSVDDLDWVSSAEQGLTVTHGQEAISPILLAAGYSCWLSRESGKPVAYGILMLVLDEASSAQHQRERPGPASASVRRCSDTCSRSPGSAARARCFSRCARPTHRRSPCTASTASGDRAPQDYYPGLDGREDAIVMRRELR